jgi:hypothetical protein
MKRRAVLLSGLAAAGNAGTLKRTPQLVIEPNGIIKASWDFGQSSRGWLAGFSDYTAGMTGLDRVAEIAPLPVELSRPGERGFFLQGQNRSDDLFMFLSKQIGPELGVQPNRNYQAHLHVQFASNAQSGCAGAGGAPGEGVYLKGGITGREPLVTPVGNYVGLNLDKGQQSNGGQELHLMATIANGRTCGSQPGYVLLSRVLYQPAPVRATEVGALWITVGTDSAFEGLTTLFYYTIGIALIPA